MRAFRQATLRAWRGREETAALRPHAVCMTARWPDPRTPGSHASSADTEGSRATGDGQDAHQSASCRRLCRDRRCLEERPLGIVVSGGTTDVVRTGRCRHDGARGLDVPRSEDRGRLGGDGVHRRPTACVPHDWGTVSVRGILRRRFRRRRRADHRDVRCHTGGFFAWLGPPLAIFVRRAFVRDLASLKGLMESGDL